jgi:class 3 adenylate cyclase/YHS domain-containing protein
MRVARTFAFVDLSGFTALTDHEGDERAVAVLNGFRSRLRETCSRRGVRIAKWLGDGAMLVCVDPAPLLGAVLELEHAVVAHRDLVPEDALDIRTGVATGPVILFEGDDYIGHAVNLAARLCDAAPPGAVLAVPELVHHLPRLGSVLQRSEARLRGLDRPVAVALLGLRPSPPGAGTDPVCGLPVWPEVAEATARAADGRELCFCSASCHDAWATRPRPPAEELGSPRGPLIGS